ncbi:hypothetical protein F0562_003652 [Nyssa sinensis]|uniref:Uncharacterized protein n=1 Tax=Nyssa sinensis TaxID=561372 RepID=A0A5J5BXW5_9ASTE|nr:hypothetical protein F0562_003652 [Nyssa sinensis]
MSSIWSPLVSSRLFPPVVSFQLGDGHGNGLSLTMPPIELGPSTQRKRKLSYDDDEENGLLLENNNISTLINKATAKIKKKISTCVLNNLNNNYIKFKEKRKNKPFDFSPNPLPVKAAPTIPTPTKQGWAKTCVVGLKTKKGRGEAYRGGAAPRYISKRFRQLLKDIRTAEISSYFDSLCFGLYFFRISFKLSGSALNVPVLIL